MNIKKTKNYDIEYGKDNILKDKDFESKNIRQRISIMIPENILEELRREASKADIGYQTLINNVLKSYVSGQDNLEERVAKIESVLKMA